MLQGFETLELNHFVPQQFSSKAELQVVEQQIQQAENIGIASLFVTLVI